MPHGGPRKEHKKGQTIRKTLTRGPNKGKSVVFKIAKGGKAYPVRRGGKKV